MTTSIPMQETDITVGVVCTGNTCRSPVMGAWLRELSGGLVQPWTAGLRVFRQNQSANKWTWLAAEAMQAPKAVTDQLKRHKTFRVSGRKETTSHLIWLTGEEEQGQRLFGIAGPTRRRYMEGIARRLRAVLTTVSVPDNAHPVFVRHKKKKATDQEVLTAYIDQANEIRGICAELLAKRNQTDEPGSPNERG